MFIVYRSPIIKALQKATYGFGLVYLLMFNMGCSQPRQTPDSTVTPGPVGAPATPAPQPGTPALSETGSPAASPGGGVAFWADAQTDPAIRQAVVDLAQADGYPVTDLAGLEPAGLSSPVRLVVAVLNTPDQQNAFRVLAENNPEGTFLALGSGSFEDLSNVVSLSSNTEQSAFVGGMIAAMVSTDWRVGLLNQTGLPESSADRDAFINGAIYFCGICTSKYGPVIRYPITADVASGGDWQTGLTALQGQFVTSLLIDPAIDTAEVQEALADAGLLFITTKGYSSEAVREYWVATIGSDPIAGLKAAWPAVISGELDPSATAQVTVSGYNENLFSEAKLRLVNEAIQLLQDGSLVPGAVSLE